MDVTRPTKATPIEFDREMSTHVVLHRIFGGCLHHAEVNAKLIDRVTPEACHQARVSLRRARSALWLFRDHLDKKIRKPLDRSLRTVGRQLSPLRDWDVFVHDTLPKLAKREKADWIGHLGEAAEAKRLSLYQEFHVDIPQPTSEVLSQLSAGYPFSMIGTAASDMLDVAYFVVRVRSRRVATPVERHDLRKAMKKLRYGVEFFSRLYDSKRVRAFLDHCKAMQDVLGEINDAQTVIHLLQELGDVPKEWQGGTEQREAKAVDHLAKHISRFRDARPFWD